jgi:nitrate reductase gamma subunit
MMLEPADAVMLKAAIAGLLLLIVMFVGMAILVRRGHVPDLKQLSRRSKWLLAAIVFVTLILPLLQTYLMQR